MKDFFVNIVRWNLKKFAQIAIWRFKPAIVVVTGNVGKTSTKEAIAAVLGADRNIRASWGSFNNEFGIPLTILGEWSEADMMLFKKSAPEGFLAQKIVVLFKVFLVSALRLIFTSSDSYPELLVLEYAADRPGDIKYLLQIAKPNISIITAIGEIPVHVEFFSGPDAIAREKSRIIEQLSSNGFAILNYDDEAIMDMRERTRAHVFTFGFGEKAEMRIMNFETRSKNERPEGISFKLEYGGSYVPVQLKGVFGKSQAYAAAAAAAVGIVFGMNMAKIADALSNYRPLKGRMTLLPGIKNSYIIDDSYNAAPTSMYSALDTLKAVKAKRKIAVLGDMAEIGKYTIGSHEEVGARVAKIADILITIGQKAKIIAEHARKHKMPRRRIFSFDTAEEAIDTVQKVIKKGDVALIKASRMVRLDKIVEEIRLK